MNKINNLLLRLFNYDYLLLWIVGILLGFSVIMVYSSSSSIYSISKYEYNTYTFLTRQSIFISIGLISGYLVFQIPTSILDKYAKKIFFTTLCMLIIVLIPFFSKDVNGARRWISIGIINLQPSEIMKLALIIYVSNYSVRKKKYINDFKKGLLPILISTSLISVLLMLESDMGALIIANSIIIGIIFLNGVNKKLFICFIIISLTIFILFILSSSWRKDRILAYLDPWNNNYIQGKSYQLTHSLIALGRGKLIGTGLGNSIAKINYLPEPHTDFIFAIIGEEIGFIGVSIVILLYYLIVKQSFKIGREAFFYGQKFSSFVAKGIGIYISSQTFINIATNLGILPTKGLTLPFISYGGSSIVLNCITISILMRIDYETKKLILNNKHE